MTTKLEILEYFLKKERIELTVTHEILMKDLGLSASGVSNWLSRLHKDGLITPKSILGQRKKLYMLTERGKQRLTWLKEKNGNTEKTNKSEKSWFDSLFDDE